jgi:hypothetical protein
MDLSHIRAPYNRRQYRGNNAYTNTTVMQDKYNNVVDVSGQQSYQCQCPKGPCFNCGKMGHFIKDCRGNPSSNISYMDIVDDDMQHVPQPSITPCHRPWGSIVAGAHVSCATRQESTACLSYASGSFLFDLSDTPFHIYHLSPIIDVAHIHLMDYLISIPLMGCFSVRTASLYYNIRDPLLAL